MGGYQFVGSSLEVDIFLKKREHKKGVLKQKIETSLNTFYLDFEIIPFTLYTYVLTKILQNGSKLIQKNGLKHHTRNLQNLKQAVGSPRS